MLSAVEEAIAICDRHENKMDDSRRKICDHLRRIQTELQARVNGASSETP